MKKEKFCKICKTSLFYGNSYRGIHIDCMEAYKEINVNKNKTKEEYTKLLNKILIKLSIVALYCYSLIGATNFKGINYYIILFTLTMGMIILLFKTKGLD